MSADSMPAAARRAGTSTWGGIARNAGMSSAVRAGIPAPPASAAASSGSSGGRGRLMAIILPARASPEAEAHVLRVPFDSAAPRSGAGGSRSLSDRA